MLNSGSELLVIKKQTSFSSKHEEYMLQTSQEVKGTLSFLDKERTLKLPYSPWSEEWFYKMQVNPNHLPLTMSIKYYLPFHQLQDLERAKPCSPCITQFLLLLFFSILLPPWSWTMTLNLFFLQSLFSISILMLAASWTSNTLLLPIKFLPPPSWHDLWLVQLWSITSSERTSFLTTSSKIMCPLVSCQVPTYFCFIFLYKAHYSLK